MSICLFLSFRLNSIVFPNHVERAHDNKKLKIIPSQDSSNLQRVDGLRRNKKRKGVVFIIYTVSSPLFFIEKAEEKLFIY